MTFDLQLRRRIGVAAWCAGLGIALIASTWRGSGAEGVGYGFAPPVDVAAVETARVGSLMVSLHDHVEVDDVVVRMDAGALERERDVLTAELLAVQDDEARLAATEARRYAEGAQDIFLDQARLGMDLREDQALLGTLEEQLALENELAGTGATSEQSVAEWQRQIRVVSARIEANQSALAVLRQESTDARARRDAAPAHNNWQVVVATRRLEQLDQRIQTLDLKAGTDGQVTWIYRAEGEVVRAGEPVLQVRQMATREVVAYLPPPKAIGLTAGQTASVRRTTGQVLDGELVSVGAGPQMLPEYLWGNPAYPEYGVPVRVRLASEIAPDEAVTVRL